MESIKKKCKSCGSDKTNIQIVNTIKHKQGNGCLFFIFFGWLYILWIICKWTFILIIWLGYQLCYGIWRRWDCKKNNKPFEEHEWLRKLMMRRGKAHNIEKTMMVCQMCGYREEIKNN